MDALQVKQDINDEYYLVVNKKRIDRQTYAQIFLDLYSKNQPYVLMQDKEGLYNLFDVFNKKYVLPKPSKVGIVKDSKGKMAGVLFKVHGDIKFVLKNKKLQNIVKFYYEKVNGKFFVYGLNSNDNIICIYRPQETRQEYTQETAYKFSQKPFLFMCLDLEKSDFSILNAHSILTKIHNFYAMIKLDLDNDSVVANRLNKQKESLVNGVREYIRSYLLDKQNEQNDKIMEAKKLLDDFEFELENMSETKKD